MDNDRIFIVIVKYGGMIVELIGGKVDMFDQRKAIAVFY